MQDAARGARERAACSSKATRRGCVSGSSCSMIADDEGVWVAAGAAEWVMPSWTSMAFRRWMTLSRTPPRGFSSFDMAKGAEIELEVLLYGLMVWGSL